MEYRTLGRTGVKVSSLALGALNFGDTTAAPEAYQIVNRAVEAGINLIDTADYYHAGESERITGRALKENGHRSQVLLATKVWFPTGSLPNDGGASRYHIIQACENSLRRLQTDYIDLYQLHRPSFDIPQDETLRAFDDLVRAGKVIYIGCSTHPAWYVMEALSISEKRNLVQYVSEQPPYNLLDRRIENELVPLCQRYGLAILPWSPMGMGILAGRYPLSQELPTDSRAGRHGGVYKDRISQRALQVGDRFVHLAKERGISPAQLALLWVRDQPGVTSPIIGPRTIEQLEEFLQISEMKLDEAEMPLFDELVPPGTAVANFLNNSGWSKMQILD